MSIEKKEQIYRGLTEIKINRTRSKGKQTPETLPSPFTTVPPDSQNETVVLATNEADNTDFVYSKDGYLNAVPVGGDAASECFNWFRQRFFRLDDVVTTAASVTINSASGKFLAAYTYPMNFVLLSGKTDGSALVGTLARVSDTQATLSVAADVALSAGVMWFGESLAEISANALKAAGHSLFAANETANTIIPRWDNAVGCAEIGSNADDVFDLACPLPNNAARPGLRLYFSAIIARRTGAAINPNPLRLSAGVWDSTATQSRFVEAANLVLTLQTVGATGATDYQYKVIATMDSGLKIESAVTTITGANVLSTSNYNRLSWSNVRGILDFEIQRLVGGVYKKIFTISNGSTSYNDYGQYDEGAISGFTSIGASRALAYAEKVFTLGDEDVWQLVKFFIDIPPTYNSSATTSAQWLRISVSGTQTDVRALLVDRVLLSLSDGGWNVSNRDRALSQSGVPDVNPIGSNQGDTGIYTCLTGAMPLVVGTGNGRIKTSQRIDTLDKGVFADDGGQGMTRMTALRRASVPHYFEVILSNNIRVDCTETERFITSRADKSGTMLKHLAVGDEVLTKFVYFDEEGKITGERVMRAEIVIIRAIVGETFVYTPSFKNAKTFVAGADLDLERAKSAIGGAILHNLKNDNGGGRYDIY